MSRSRLWLVGLLACAAGCAGTEADEPVSESAPLAVIQVAQGRQLEFHASGNGVMVAERYLLGQPPLLSDADKRLSAPDLYRKFAPPRAEIPASLYGKQELSAETVADAPGATTQSSWGGGQAAPELVAGDVSRTTGALNLGDGCHPPQSNVVFADCRSNWFGGYFAQGIATWFLDDRVQAVRGSLDTVVTQRIDGSSKTSTFHVAQGTVLNQHWPKNRVCTRIPVVDINLSCSDVKTQRRIDIVNASSTTFNVDDVFFN